MHILCNEKLSGEVTADKHAVYQALGHGHSWIACDYYRKSDGFRFELHHASRSWPVGSRVKYRPGLCLTVKTPAPSEVILLANGRRTRVSTGKQHCFTRIEPGIYRIEAYLKYRCRFHPWIYSNSIWVTPTP